METFTCFEEFSKSDALFSEQPSIHGGLLPGPYMGDLRNAKVVICLLNPGFSPLDYFAEDQGEFRTELLSNLRQQNQSSEYPFFALDPRFAWTGAYAWWRRKLQPVVDALTKMGLETHEAIACLGKTMSAVELVPYHSKRSPFSKKTIDSLKSAQFAKRGIEELRRRGALIVYIRSVKLWGKDYGDDYQIRDGEIRYPAKSGQSASLGGVADVIADRVYP